MTVYYVKFWHRLIPGIWKRVKIQGARTVVCLNEMDLARLLTKSCGPYVDEINIKVEHRNDG